MSDETRSQPPSVIAGPDAGLRPLAAPVATGAAFEDEPERYVVDGELGAGGMGVVLAARGERLGRPVALKLIGADREDLRRRFEREGRVTARLQHPAIVPVYGMGRGRDGRPFYAMKQVTGDPLDKVLARAASTADRLALVPKVIAVTEAIAYAHAERVIHRDLKPANVLVGAFGETVVIDWGLAKDLAATDDGDPPSDGPFRTGDADRTQHGKVMGTPAYMPLEQARGEPLDERADVYALGAILYHVLAGSPPHAREGEHGVPWETMLARVITTEPEPLAKRQPELPPDLLAIVARAMARTPAERYATAGELAEDLRRFQTGQLVGAHRYSTWQLVRRWVRKHRAAVSVGVVAVLALAVVAAVSLKQILDEQARTEEQRALAVASRDAAEDLVGFMIGDLRVKLAPAGKLDALDEVARRAAAYFATRTGTLTLTNDEQRKRAIAIANLGDVVLEQGDLAGALAHYDTSLGLHSALASRAPGTMHQQNVAAVHHQRSNALRMMGKHAEALAAARESFAIAQRLAAEHPVDLERQRDVALGHERIAQVLRATDHAAALVELRAAERLTEARARSTPADATARHDLWNARGAIGDVLLAQGDRAAALAQYRAMLPIAERAVAADPKDRRAQHDLAVSHSRIADVLQQQGDVGGALAALQLATPISEQLVAWDPTNTNWLRDLSIDLVKLGDLHAARKDHTVARAKYEAAVRIGTQLAARDPSNAEWQRDLAVEHGRLGAFLLDRGDPAAAFGHLDASLSIRQRLSDRDPKNAMALFDLAKGYGTFGELLEKRGDRDAALVAYQKNLTVMRQLAARAPNEPLMQRELSVALELVGELLVRTGDFAAALTILRESLAISDRLAKLDPKSVEPRDDLAYGHSSLGKAQLAASDRAGALASFEAALAIREALVAEDPESEDLRDGLANVLLHLGKARAALGDRVAARTAFARSLALFGKLPADADRAKAISELRQLSR